jgi:hypothetical protein
MKLRLLFAAAALALPLATPAIAKDVTLTLSDQEQQGLLQLLDRATRDGGLAAVNGGTVYFYNKLKLAVDVANAAPAAKPQETPKPAEPAAATPPAEPPAP